MPQSDDGTYGFPIACPTCRAVAGMPYTAGTTINQNGELVVGLRCTDCHHEWRIDMPVISPVLRPKPNRRTAKATVRVSSKRVGFKRAR